MARLGGDEFAILLEGIRSETDVERIAVPITEAFNRPLLVDGRETDATASIGAACSQPGDDAEQLLRKADIAMYNAKAAGKARCVLFQPHMQEQLHDRLRLEQDIDLAFARNEFFVEFQPVVDLTSRELLGVEALVRWNHPQRGVVMPGSFISIAEESGRIVELGRRVLVDACTQIRAWSDSVDAGAGLRVAVNISGRHLQQGDLVADVRHALEVSGLDPGNLVIELTESTIMQNTEVNLERFRELKALGVRLAIDDFGMGYSSLSYLHRFPIDILKIDRAFVSRLTEQDGGPELARAVVMLGDDARSRDSRRRHREREPGGDPARPRLRGGPGIPVRLLELARRRGRDNVHGTPRRPAGSARHRFGPHRDRTLSGGGTLAALGRGLSSIPANSVANRCASPGQRAER